MYEIKFAILYPTPKSKKIQVQNFSLIRKSRRVSYSFLLGGRDSVYLGFDVDLELSFDELNLDDWRFLNEVNSAIRSGVGVVADGFFYKGTAIRPESMGVQLFDSETPLTLDIARNEIVEFMVEWAEKKPFSIVYEVKNAASPDWNSIYEI